MYHDNKDLLISETSPLPGGLGDSCANTSREETLQGGEYWQRLAHFFTPLGEIRHPDAPEGWRQDDFSVDQWLPLYVACSLYTPFYRHWMLRRLRRRFYRVGNGQLINPIIFATVRRSNGKASWVWDLALLGHALLSKLPFRWSDSERRFERSAESSSDYLNWFIAVLFAHRTKSVTWTLRLALKVITRERMRDRAVHYHSKEPRCQWLLSLYVREIDAVYNSHSGAVKEV